VLIVTAAVPLSHQVKAVSEPNLLPQNRIRSQASSHSSRNQRREEATYTIGTTSKLAYLPKEDSHHRSGAATLLMAGYVFLAALPDLHRYLRISTM